MLRLAPAANSATTDARHDPCHGRGFFVSTHQPNHVSLMAQRGEFITLCRDPCAAGPSQRSLACLHSARPSDRVLQCPSCQHSDSRVLESRAADAGRSVRRRRECLNCEFRFTTYERVETMPISVVKRSGHRETFSRSKLLTGLVRACEKTGLDTSRLELLVDDIEVQLQQRNQNNFSSTHIQSTH